MPRDEVRGSKKVGTTGGIILPKDRSPIQSLRFPIPNPLLSISSLGSRLNQFVLREFLNQAWTVDLSVGILGQSVEGTPANREHIAGYELFEVFAKGGR